MVVKRKRTAYNLFKKRKSAKSSLRTTDAHGDVIPSAMSRVAASINRPNRLTKASFHCSHGTISGGTTTGLGLAYTFQLNQVANYLQIASFFDQYRFVSVELHFMPMHNQIPLAASTQGRLITAIDFDNAAVPGSANDLRNYDNCIITSAGQNQKRRLVPHSASAAYGGAFTSYQNDVNQWFDTAYPAVQHYAVLAWVEPSTTTSTVFNVEATYFFEFKGIRAL